MLCTRRKGEFYTCNTQEAYQRLLDLNLMDRNIYDYTRMRQTTIFQQLEAIIGSYKSDVLGKDMGRLLNMLFRVPHPHPGSLPSGFVCHLHSSPWLQLIWLLVTLHARLPSLVWHTVLVFKYCLCFSRLMQHLPAQAPGQSN